jgi:phosphoribosyl-ATP pyrophosphohydrolase
MDTLARLEQIIKERRAASPDESYVAKLNSRGLPEIARKVGEEAVETAVAAISYEKEQVIGEAADLLFHLLVLLDARQVPLAEVLAELERREGVSGLDEKASRSR